MYKTNACLFALLGLASAMVHATPVYSDTSEFVTLRYCIRLGQTNCDDVTPILAGALGGFPGALSSSAIMPSTPTFGSGSGSVSLSGVVGAPILRATATSDAGARVNTNSAALQQYTYTGAAPTTRTFGGTLTYSQSIVAGGPYPGDIGNGISAHIAVFTLPGGFDAGATAQSNADALHDPSTQAGFTLLNSADFFDTFSNASGDTDFGTTVTLNPGEAVFVWVLIQTVAVNGSSIDASHTFVTQWNDSSNLTPADVAVVPEPASLALLGIGIAGLCFSRRKQ